MVINRHICVLALVINALFFGSTLSGAVEPFWFVQITDTHIGVKGADELLSATLADIQANFPEAEFAIHTGDLTEMGSDDELSTYVQLIRGWPFPVYHTIGNHDSRWSETGKTRFRELVGPTRLSLRHKGVQFLLVDSAMLAEHHGHYNKDDLEWLEEELKKLPPDVPAVISVHHPPLMPASTTDNDTELGELIARYNVPLVLVGHGHNFSCYTLNGTTYTMGASTSYAGPLGAPSYRAFYVDEKGFLPYLRQVARDKTTSQTLIPRRKPVDPYGELLVGRVDFDKKGGSRLDCRLTSVGRARLTTGTYELDKAYRGIFTFRPEGRFTIESPTSAPGFHRLSITFVDDRKSTHTRSRLFEIQPPSRLSKVPRLVRSFEMPSTIQSSPARWKNLLFVGCNDGTLRAFDLLYGKVVWETRLGGEILSSPSVSVGRVVVGCNDYKIYCLDAYDGELRWSFSTGAAVMASPRIDGDRVYVGSGDGRMYCFNLETGKLVWKFPAEKMVKCRPALADKTLFFGAWDNWFYAVDAERGRLKWKVPVSVTPQFSAATANPVTTGTRVLFTSHDYCTRCLDAKTGSHLWMYRPLGEELGPSYSSFALRGNIAYASTIGGRIVGFDMLSGRKVADISVRAGVRDELFDSNPVIEGAYLYVGSTGGNLYCVNLDKKAVEWSFALQPGFIFTTPVLWGDRVLIASSTGTVYEIQRPECSADLPFSLSPQVSKTAERAERN